MSFYHILFDKENKEGNSLETPNEEEKLENIVPDQEEYNISPLKVFTFFLIDMKVSLQKNYLKD